MRQDPLIVFGMPRSGTTITHRLLCCHPRAAWLSILSSRYPARPGSNQWLMRALDLPLLGEMLQKRLVPGECYEFWEYHCPGFRRPCRDLLASDVTSRQRARLTEAFSRLTTSRRNRLVLKITGWPRLGFLNEIFPEARYVHVLRDGRAVANSLLAIWFWWGWQGPQNWRWGELPADQRGLWERHDRSFVALAGIAWNIYLQALEAAIPQIPSDRLTEIRYESLCTDPGGEIRRLAEFGGLSWTSRYASLVAGRSVRSANEKWRRDLTPAQQVILEDVLADSLRRKGYT
jgi:hypothetical protein